MGLLLCLFFEKYNALITKLISRSTENKYTFAQVHMKWVSDLPQPRKVAGLCFTAGWSLSLAECDILDLQPAASELSAPSLKVTSPKKDTWAERRGGHAQRDDARSKLKRSWHTHLYACSCCGPRRAGICVSDCAHACNSECEECFDGLWSPTSIPESLDKYFFPGFM